MKRTSVRACAGAFGVDAEAEPEPDADAEVDAVAGEARSDVAASKRACMTGVSGVADGCATTKDWMSDESVPGLIACVTKASRSAKGVTLSAIALGEGTCGRTGREVSKENLSS